MAETNTEKKPTSVTTVLIRIAVAVLIPLFTVWYLDRENRIHDLKESNNYLRVENRELKADGKEKDKVIEHWIDEYINCNRQIPQIIDTLKARIKRQKDE